MIETLLAQSDIFADLSMTQLSQVAALGQKVTIDAGVLIFEENSDSDTFYLILDGQVDIRIDPSLVAKSGHPQPERIATLRKGQSFGEIALVDQGVRSASAVCSAEGPCELMAFQRADLMALLRSDLTIGFTVMNNLASELCLKMRQTNLLVRETLLMQHIAQQ